MASFSFADRGQDIRFFEYFAIAVGPACRGQLVFVRLKLNRPNTEQVAHQKKRENRMSILDKFHYSITGPRPESITGGAPVPRLVFLHGTMGYAANWRRVARHFEDRFEVLVFDQRGHGRSFQPAIGYAAQNFADDLEQVLDALGWDQVNLVGHSMGGRVAYRFAAEHPERVVKLVIEDIGPTNHPTSASLVVRMLDAVPVPFASKAAAKDYFHTSFVEAFDSENNVRGLAEYLFANIKENEKGQAVWRFFEPGVRESVAQARADQRWEDIESLRSPTLLLRGERSKDLPRDVFDKMLQLNDRIEGLEIQNSGHWIHSEQPERFIRAIDEFLSRP